MVGSARGAPTASPGGRRRCARRLDAGPGAESPGPDFPASKDPPRCASSARTNVISQEGDSVVQTESPGRYAIMSPKAVALFAGGMTWVAASLTSWPVATDTELAGN